MVINEIMFHPVSEDPRDEWIELYNTSTDPANLAGWRLASGVQYSFPNVTLD